MAIQTLMTVQEFEAASGDLGPCELVRGEVVPLSPGGTEHSVVSMNASGLLWQWARRSMLGRVLTNEAGIVIQRDPGTVRGADVAYISYRRLPRGRRYTGFTAVPPELVVEIIGKGQGWREMVEKAGEYLRMGVDRVWVLDPDTRRVHVFRPDAEPTVLSENETIADEAVLPGFSCAVAEFFAE